MYLLNKFTIGIKCFIFSFIGMLLSLIVFVVMSYVIRKYFPLVSLNIKDLGRNYYLVKNTNEIVYSKNIKNDIDWWYTDTISEVVIPNVLQAAYNDNYIIVSSINEIDNKIVYWIIDKRKENKIIGEWNITYKATNIGWKDTVYKYNTYSNIYKSKSIVDFNKIKNNLKIHFYLPKYKTILEEDLP